MQRGRESRRGERNRYWVGFSPQEEREQVEVWNDTNESDNDSQQERKRIQPEPQLPDGHVSPLPPAVSAKRKQLERLRRSPPPSLQALFAPLNASGSVGIFAASPTET